MLFERNEVNALSINVVSQGTGAVQIWGSEAERFRLRFSPKDWNLESPCL